MMQKRKTAKQIAAAKRNIVKAQRASADSRRGKSRNVKAGHHYGTGSGGRKNTRRALYGSRRHGISPTQHLRRQQRARKWKNRAAVVGSAAAIGVAVYSNYHKTTSPEQRAKHRAAAKDYAQGVKTKVRYHTSGIGRQIRKSQKKAKRNG
jgi:uncharacterized membrane protein YebE (DUF533 family)